MPTHPSARVNATWRHSNSAHQAKVTADIHCHESASAHPGCVADDGAETEYAAVAPERSHATMVTADDDAGGDRLSDTAGVLATTMPLN